MRRSLWRGGDIEGGRRRSLWGGRGYRKKGEEGVGKRKWEKRKGGGWLERMGYYGEKDTNGG